MISIESEREVPIFYLFLEINRFGKKNLKTPRKSEKIGGTNGIFLKVQRMGAISKIQSEAYLLPVSICLQMITPAVGRRTMMQ